MEDQELIKLRSLVENVLQTYYANIQQAKAIESGQLLRSSREFEIDIQGNHFLVTLHLPKQWALVEYGYKKNIVSVKKQAPRHWKSTVPQTMTEVLPRPLLENAIKSNLDTLEDICGVIFQAVASDIDTELEKIEKIK